MSVFRFAHAASAVVRVLATSLAAVAIPYGPLSLLDLPSATAQFAGFADEDELERKSGLIARYTDPAGNSFSRFDDQISFDWGTAAPDPRLPQGTFSAEWQGQLFARPTGEYRLHLFVQGDVTVEVDGETVLEGASDQPRWLTSDEVSWSVGYHPIRVRYTKTGDEGRLGLYWSGPAFALEPVSANDLTHEETETAERVADLERGRELVDAYRCAACHDLPGAPPRMPAPSLENLSGNLNPSWLVDMLQDRSANPHRNMPGFGFDRQTAIDVTAALLAASKPTASAAPAEPKKSSKGKNAKKAKGPDPKRGEQLLTSVGCLACHVYQDLGSGDLFGGGDLTTIARKRPARFFARWLRDPAAVNPQHRMPRFDLTAAEQADFVAFLQRLHGTSGDDAKAGPVDPKGATDLDPKLLAAADPEAGRRAIETAGCVSCHALPRSSRGDLSSAFAANKRVATPLTAQSDWSHGCVAEPRPERSQPGYRLSEADAEAIQHYVATTADAASSDQLTARALLRRSQCFACHPRGAGSGISETALTVARRYSDVVAHVAALIPPSLNSIGDKLQDESLRKSIAGKADRQRPWLSVRMPRFPLSEGEIDQLAEAFVAMDRIPAAAPATAQPSRPAPSAVALRTVGARLVTSSGFGCTSCHAIGDVKPGEAPVSSKGPNLRELGNRVRPEWFRRWVSNPLRIVPRVEMPAIATPVAGVLDNHLEHQVDAVWHVLNLPDFHPPKPNPVRVVRRQGIESAGERAAVITDVLHSDGAVRIKPLLIGLPNRQNIVFDLAEARIDGWWSGDTAYQRTEGKRWFWETAGANIWPLAPTEELAAAAPVRHAEWLLVGGEGSEPQRLVPQRIGQFLTEVDRWQHTGDGGLRFSHRLHFDASPTSIDADRDSLLTVVVEQTFRPRWSASGENRAAWSRELQVDRLPIGWRLLHRPLPIPTDAAATVSRDPDASPAEMRLTGASGAQITVTASAATKIAPNDEWADGWWEVPTKNEKESGSVAATVTPYLEYSAEIPVDQYPLLPVETAFETALSLKVLPGFSAEQLPLPQDIMPTAFSWHPDGSLYITDLKGPVWHLTDSDSDGDFDSTRAFCDDLATPFGIHAHEDYVDVINKYALLRLWDDSGDGFADRVEALASGWGHTADYHDWAVGLPQTEDGSYYVSLACQQDKRSRAAANLRGTVIRLNPREPSPDNPHRFAIEPLTAGHRFPIGIAQDRDGEIYVTDNQGNYKPFNELNHVVPGAHFGFINLLDRDSDTTPKRTPPAIDIPHPWTRSVNGICFLHTPSGFDQSAFGPFEGHLVGCEYDTRRLVRMSLQHVGDHVQGAVYPLTYTTPPAGPPLLGPISCSVSPDGALYVGNLRESGWGAGSNIGNLVRMRLQPDALPAGIAEVRAIATGFEISFTRPVDPAKAVDPESYTIASYTRVSTPQYGGEDKQRRSETIQSLEYDAERQSVTIELPEMRPDFVYEFELASLVEEGEVFFPAEAFYTLRKLVPESPGKP